MVERNLIGRSFITIQSETAAGIGRESPIVSHDEESSWIDWEFADAASSFCLDSTEIGFIKRIALFRVILIIADFYPIIDYFDGFPWKSDDSFDVRDILAGRYEDDDVASLELAESGSHLIDDDEIIFSERRKHACSDYRIWISHEKSYE